MIFRPSIAAVATVFILSLGCNTKPKLAQLSGNVTFKGQPVPAGFVSLTPNIDAGTRGSITVFQIKDGKYDSSKERTPGIPPGVYTASISGFDGVRIPLYGQGKQIFNPVNDIEVTVPEGVSTRDFEIPESAGQNVKIQPTADT